MSGFFRRDRPVTVVKPGIREVIHPPARQAWDEKRWTRAENDGAVQLNGRYRVLDRRRGQWREFKGCLRMEEGEILTYIADPPTEIKGHPHGACFQLVERPWFLVHWEKPPRTFDDGLLYIERVLSEAINC